MQNDVVEVVEAEQPVPTDGRVLRVDFLEGAPAERKPGAAASNLPDPPADARHAHGSVRSRAPGPTPTLYSGGPAPSALGG